MNNVKVIDITCISHTIDLIGKEMKNQCSEYTNQFIQSFTSMCNSSPTARNYIRTRLSCSLKLSHKIRWFAWNESAIFLYDHFEAILLILRDPSISFSPEYRKAALDAVEIDENNLCLELAFLKDCGTKLIQLCYCQEGDGELLISETMSCIESLNSHFQTHLFNTNDIWRELEMFKVAENRFPGIL